MNLTFLIAFPVSHITVTLLLAVTPGPAAAVHMVFAFLAVTRAIPERKALTPLARGPSMHVLQYLTLGACWAILTFRRRRATTLIVKRPLRIATLGRWCMVLTSLCRTLNFALLVRRRTWKLERFFLWRRLNVLALAPLKPMF